MDEAVGLKWTVWCSEAKFIRSLTHSLCHLIYLTKIKTIRTRSGTELYNFANSENLFGEHIKYRPNVCVHETTVNPGLNADYFVKLSWLSLFALPTEYIWTVNAMAKIEHFPSDWRRVPTHTRRECRVWKKKRPKFSRWRRWRTVIRRMKCECGHPAMNKWPKRKFVDDKVFAMIHKRSDMDACINPMHKSAKYSNK